MNDEIKCHHQFFETTKVIDSLGDSGVGIAVNYKNGVKVMCALCGKQRNLWNNGDIEEFNNDEWEML